jgi:ABC-2 type transport system permease protein
VSRAAVIRGGRALRGALWLGWEISSSWTRPVPFAVYALLKPLSGALILAVMYRVVAGDRAQAHLAFLVIGTALWSFVQSGLGGFANSVSEDRSMYRTLKYIYMAPQHPYVYLGGRAAAQLATALVSATAVLLVATPALHLPIDPLHIGWPLLVAACLCAVVATVSLGVGVAVLLLGARDSHGRGEIIASTLYLVSGAIFPISILPGALAAFAAWLPFAYWLELVRRALLGARAPLMFPALSDGAVLLRLLLTTALAVLVAHLLFVWGDRRARRLGLIDRASSW